MVQNKGLEDFRVLDTVEDHRGDYINRKKPLVVYNLFILAKQNVSCYAHVSSYENTGFSRICEVLFADWRH